LLNEGYAASFKELIEGTDWEEYGLGRNAKCANCMLHSGFEATAVTDMFAHPIKAIRMSIIGPRTNGPLAPDLALVEGETVGGSRPVLVDQ
jgi:hypothetical protein